MPLVKIDLIKGKKPEEIKQIMDVTHHVLLKTFQVPEGDRYQIVTQHEPYEMILEDTGLGFSRSSNVLLFTVISTQRTDKMKQDFYRILTDKLKSECQIDSKDVMITFVTNGAGEWSFGFGKAQFLTGDL
ncbi:MAG: tautomerase family protein [Bacillota bacterium]|uniref:Tautomerase family protein n=1 Tax=Virgibacillus salarius TaxID=447199 RepID=A0A941IB68_9BACI|nr:MULTISPECIES: tautomerase family protein [Bacillaceae]MBR7796097.1 tautomerase family protein [Virgibacillus salarius]MDY7042936.1 tautomerase family protein [Virgibacillus sp. M23]NAZ08806.1 tautomerase family protein [Agaribacter marinus]WBX81539.1 tautomerase family protein [Virgibacillus salarius]